MYTPEIFSGNEEKQKEEIEKKLKQLQVLYCDRIYNKYINENKKTGAIIDKKFSDIVEEYGHQVAGDVRLKTILESEIDLSEDEQSIKATDFYQYIDKIYNELPKIESDDISPEHINKRIEELKPITNYLEAEIEKAKRDFPEKWDKLNEMDPEKTTEVIIFNFLNEYDTPEIREIKEALKKEGYTESDNIIELHLPLKLGEEKITPEKINESLEILAKKIKNNFPEIQGMTMKSWMLDDPKFDNLFSMKKVGVSGSNWRQLIGGNGQLHQDRIEKLLSTGEMPYRNLIGYISTEDFLDEYLKEKN